MSPAPPDKVVLFSGHMIDGPDRAPRFPPHKGPVTAAKIAETLAVIGTGRSELAICGGACGGDLLFAEACLVRGMDLELYIPFGEPAFLANSFDFADADWHGRFLAARSRAALRVKPEEPGPLPTDENPYERNNPWMLQSATRFGARRMMAWKAMPREA